MIHLASTTSEDSDRVRIRIRVSVCVEERGRGYGTNGACMYIIHYLHITSHHIRSHQDVVLGFRLGGLTGLGAGSITLRCACRWTVVTVNMKTQLRTRRAMFDQTPN